MITNKKLMNMVIKPSNQLGGYKPKYGYSDYYNNYNGIKKVGSDGYLYLGIMSLGSNWKTYIKYITEHGMRARNAFGGELPIGAVVHHHNANQLVICQDKDYHKFLHKRIKKLKCKYLAKKYCSDGDKKININSHNRTLRHSISVTIIEGL